MRQAWTSLRGALGLGPIAAPALGTPDDAAFAAHARALTGYNLRLAALFIFACTLVSWIADPFTYGVAPEIAHRLTWMRACHAGSGFVLYQVLRRPGLARCTDVAALAVVAVDTSVMAYFLGCLGDLSTPWFHFTYVSAVGLLLPVVGLGMRVLYGATFAAGLAAGFVLARPEIPRAPMLVPTVTFLLLVTVVGVALGHVVYRLIEREFWSDRAQSRSALALEELNQTLEQRVDKQTQELRLLAVHLERAREDERTRIARELHDELGQELTALRYTLTFTRQRFERDPASVRANLDELDLLLGRTATTTRQILSDLRPRILDDLGLDAGVEWLLKRTEERAGLTCRLVSACRKLDVDVEVSIAAFRILQESLTNVVRHAQATHVDVEISVEAGEMCLIVRDDGVGMPAPRSLRVPLPGKGGMGLIGMRERVGALGGTLRFESTPGTGTTVRVHLPLTRPLFAMEQA